MKWVRVESRMLGAVAYNGDWRQLYLRFRSGDIYCYKGVPLERYQELLAADSKGEYARGHILNGYPYQRIRSAVRTASGPENRIARKVTVWRIEGIRLAQPTSWLA